MKILTYRERPNVNLQKIDMLQSAVGLSFLTMLLLALVFTIFGAKNEHERLIEVEKLVGKTTELEDKHTEVISEILPFYDCTGVTR